jgi:hypothetical protein
MNIGEYMSPLQEIASPRITSFFRQLKLLCLSPDKFFAERSTRPVNLKTPFLIVCGLFLVEIGGNYDTITAYTRTLELADPSAYPIVYVGLAATALSPFLAWISYSAVFYGVSYLYRGRGTFLRTLVYVGYGCAPLIIGGLLHLVLFQFVSLPVQDHFIPARVAAHATTVALIDAGIAIPVLLWCGFLWTAGMRHARSLSARQALVTVFVPVGLAIGAKIVWLLWKLISVAKLYTGL